MANGLVTTAAALILGMSGIEAQTPLQFEIATVKASNPDKRGTSIMLQPGGGLKVEGATLKQLTSMAYSVRDFQVTGGPSWINSDRFDIQAKPEQSDNPATPVRDFTDAQRNEFERQFKERLLSLLADRFQLIARKETKEMPVYALVQAKGGAKLKISAPDAQGNRGIRMQRGVMNGMSAELRFLADSLSNILGRPVIDKTGLEGKFDWKLEWTPDINSEKPAIPGDTPANPPELSGPSVFTALQEQLGLKLDAQKGPATLVVIDKAEKPSAN